MDPHVVVSSVNGCVDANAPMSREQSRDVCR
jgi:hypothetical protein